MTSSDWQQALARVENEIVPDDFRNVIQNLNPLRDTAHRLVVEAPNRMVADVVLGRYLMLLENALSAVTDGRLTTIEVALRGPQQAELFPVPTQELSLPPESTAFLQPKYTFENFVIGASNQFAHAAAKAVSSQPGVHYNPLFIYGGVGLGKTHLVHAIGHQILDHHPAFRIVYLSSESFMNELIAALRRDRMDEFKNRFRQIDVLMLDDVQFLAGRERTQEEFFHTFNSLYESHRQIILTSDKFPKEIPDLEERLRNRFEWGLIADIQSPDMETRVAILEKKAEFERIELPHDVALFLASKITSNVRELEGSLTRLGAFASLNKSPITEAFARQVLGSILSEKKDTAITIETIQRTVCDFYNVRPNDLRSKKRTRSIAFPRQVAMFLCRRHTDASFPVIGDRFGGRDHSTVIHAAQLIERRMRAEESFRETIEKLDRLVVQNS